MGFIIFRLIIFIGLIWLGVRFLKIYNQKKLEARQKEQVSDRDRSGSEQMVRCNYCNLHLPQKDAVQHESLWFCCKEHKQHFLDHGPEQK